MKGEAQKMKDEYVVSSFSFVPTVPNFTSIFIFLYIFYIMILSSVNMLLLIEIISTCESIITYYIYYSLIHMYSFFISYFISFIIFYYTNTLLDMGTKP